VYNSDTDITALDTTMKIDVVNTIGSSDADVLATKVEAWREMGYSDKTINDVVKKEMLKVKDAANHDYWPELLTNNDVDYDNLKGLMKSLGVKKPKGSTKDYLNKLKADKIAMEQQAEKDFKEGTKSRAQKLEEYTASLRAGSAGRLAEVNKKAPYNWQDKQYQSQVARTNAYLVQNPGAVAGSEVKEGDSSVSSYLAGLVKPQGVVTTIPNYQQPAVDSKEQIQAYLDGLATKSTGQNTNGVVNPKLNQASVLGYDKNQTTFLKEGSWLANWLEGKEEPTNSLNPGAQRNSKAILTTNPGRSRSTKSNYEGSTIDVDLYNQMQEHKPYTVEDARRDVPASTTKVLAEDANQTTAVVNDTNQTAADMDSVTEGTNTPWAKTTVDNNKSLDGKELQVYTRPKDMTQKEAEELAPNGDLPALVDSSRWQLLHTAKSYEEYNEGVSKKEQLSLEQFEAVKDTLNEKSEARLNSLLDMGLDYVQGQFYDPVSGKTVEVLDEDTAFKLGEKGWVDLETLYNKRLKH